MKNYNTALPLLLLFVFLTNAGWGQSFLGLNGGFEGTAIIDNANIFTVAQAGKWTKSDTTITLANETTVARSGANSLKISMTSTAMKRVYTPEYTILSSTSKWYVQYYRRSPSTINTQTQQPGNIRDSVEQASSTYSSVAASNTWEKVTYAPASISAATTVAGVIKTKATGTGGDVYIDDFCIYAAPTVDNAPPHSPTLPTTSQTANIDELFVSWTEASGGVDGGGYMSVRKAESVPNTIPNVNGIYAVGNTIAVGENIAYIGSSPSFTDTGLDPDSIYYYTIYTFDKAYNYSLGVSTVGDLPLPVQLTSFSASVSSMGVGLNWRTATETNCYGFDVERRSVSNPKWSKIGFIQGFGNSTAPREYAYLDAKIVFGHYLYRLKQIDQDANFRYSGNAEVEIRTVQNTFFCNYPNPFNSITMIRYQLLAVSYVTLKVYDVLGREIVNLVDGLKNFGYYTAVFDASGLTSGIYFARFVIQPEDGSKQIVQTRKMLLTK